MSLSEFAELHFGPVGTPARDRFDSEIRSGIQVRMFFHITAKDSYGCQRDLDIVELSEN